MTTTRDRVHAMPMAVRRDACPQLPYHNDRSNNNHRVGEGNGRATAFPNTSTRCPTPPAHTTPPDSQANPTLLDLEHTKDAPRFHRTCHDRPRRRDDLARDRTPGDHYPLRRRRRTAIDDEGWPYDIGCT